MIYIHTCRKSISSSSISVNHNLTQWLFWRVSQNWLFKKWQMIQHPSYTAHMVYQFKRKFKKTQVHTGKRRKKEPVKIKVWAGLGEKHV